MEYIISPLRQFTLKFIDEQCDKNYDQRVSLFQQQLFSLFFLMHSIILVADIIYDFAVMDQPVDGAARIIQLVFLLVGSFISYRYKYCMKYITFMAISAQIIISYGFLLDIALKIMQIQELIIFGVYNTVLTMVAVLILQNWIEKCMILLEYGLLLISFGQPSIYFRVLVSIITMLLIKLFYNLEKHDKEIFYQVYLRDNNLQEYKELIDYTLPDAICVCKYDYKEKQLNESFFNQAWRRIFQDQSFKNVLQNIIIEHNNTLHSISSQEPQMQHQQQQFQQQQQHHQQQPQQPAECNSEENNQNSGFQLKPQNLEQTILEKYKKTSKFSYTSQQSKGAMFLAQNINEVFLNCRYLSKIVTISSPMKKNKTKSIIIGGSGNADTINNSNNNNQNNSIKSSTEHFFNIKIVECVWENKQSIMILLNDISMKVRNQQLQQMDKYKDELLATVTHDLKTPLNGMIQHLESTVSITDITLIRKYIDISLNNAHLLLFLVKDILDYSQIKVNKCNLDTTTFRLENTIRDIIQLLQYTIQAKNNQVTYKINLSFDTFKTDQNRLKQILLNLVSNALKFTKNGFIEIIAEHDIPLDQQIVAISVADSGVGIPQKIQQKLFQLYSTFDLNTGENKHGIGLGLVITKKLVQILGPEDQQIMIDSQVGKGTKFTFKIYQNVEHKSRSDTICHNQQLFDENGNLIDSQRDLDIQKNVDEQRYKFNEIYQKDNVIFQKEGKKAKYMLYLEPKSQNIMDIDQKRLITQPSTQIITTPLSQSSVEYHKRLAKIFDQQTKILIADDTTFNIMGLKLLLQPVQDKLIVLDAYNGEEAVIYFKESLKVNEIPIKYIFIDIQMPIKNGLEAIKEIRLECKMKKKLMTQQPIIIAMSGDNQPQEIKNCIAAGADSFLPRPYTVEQLTNLLLELRQRL